MKLLIQFAGPEEVTSFTLWSGHMGFRSLSVMIDDSAFSDTLEFCVHRHQST
jgi:hypothetical protein